MGFVFVFSRLLYNPYQLLLWIYHALNKNPYQKTMKTEMTTCATYALFNQDY